MYAFWAIYTYSGRYTRCYCTHSGKGFLPQGIWRCNDETPPIPGQRHASPYLCGNPDFFVSYSLGEITHAQHTTAHSKTAHGTTETENRNYLKYTLKKTETRNFFNDKGTRHFFLKRGFIMRPLFFTVRAVCQGVMRIAVCQGVQTGSTNILSL